jgi:hypothetical protein
MAPPLTKSAAIERAVSILVLGDMNVDSLLVPPPPVEGHVAEQENMAWQNEGNWWNHRRPGGVWLLTEIIDAALSTPSFKERFITGNAISCAAEPTKEELITRHYPGYLNSLATLGLFPRTDGSGFPDKEMVYRIEKLLGWIHTDRETIPIPGKDKTHDFQDRLIQNLELQLKTAKVEREILVLHDKASHFRWLPDEVLSRILEKEFTKDKTWIVWQMYGPVADGALWRVISENPDWIARTIAVVKMESLREEGVNLPRTVSLEEESRLFAEAMNTVPSMQRLKKVRHIVVHPNREGALHYDTVSHQQSACYYCSYINDDPRSRARGVMVGYTSILVAAIVRGMVWSLIEGRNHPEEGIIAGMKQGIVLDHLHYVKGFGEKSAFGGTETPAPYVELFKTLTAVKSQKWDYEGRRYYLAAMDLPPSGEDPTKWTRVEGFIKHLHDAPNSKASSLDQQAEEVAFAIIRYGIRKVVETEIENDSPSGDLPDTPPVIVRCPYEVHGKIKTAYHVEIDRFASIRRVIERYLDDERWIEPLSIAVFGPPGSGKSLTIKQIFGKISPNVALRPLEFNLAQFVDVDDLETAFRKVQDEAVAGQVPLVFFDEFDSKEFYWLKNFLAPMQDGRFKAGESTYRIGRAVFVFAGGVSESWQQFKTSAGAQKELKGPDFISRLRGHLDIVSINGSDDFGGVKSDADNKPDTVTARSKRLLWFRRALLLRSLLETYLPDVLDNNSKEARIDTDVMRAFIQIPQYSHEARSMQAILEMSRLSPRGVLQKSSLPTEDQLIMHVDASKFLKIAHPK